jgi:hypothetical protein
MSVVFAPNLPNYRPPATRFNLLIEVDDTHLQLRERARYGSDDIRISQQVFGIITTQFHQWIVARAGGRFVFDLHKRYSRRLELEPGVFITPVVVGDTAHGHVQVHRYVDYPDFGFELPCTSGEKGSGTVQFDTDCMCITVLRPEKPLAVIVPLYPDLPEELNLCQG